MAQPDPSLVPYRKVQAANEREMRRILELTAKAIEARILQLKPGVGGVVRAAQLRLVLAEIRRLQRSLWRGSIDPRVSRDMDDAQKAAESAVEAIQRVAYAALPEPVADVLVDGLRASATSGLKSDRARKKRALSTMVYRQEALHAGKIEDTIRQGLIANLSAKELAKDVYKYVSPTTPGGVSYAAMRLARTEINNAFHERQIEGAKRPGIKAVVWNLSGSHKVPDKCNVYAAHGGNGQWDPEKVPDKPHPQCFCYLTYVSMPPEEFRAALEKGSFDDEIERRTRENMARLGQKVGPIEPKLSAVPDLPSPVRVVRRAKGTDATQWAASMMRDAKADNGLTVQSPWGDPRDTILRTVGEHQGFDGLPSLDSVDKAIQDGGIELWRGVIPFEGNKVSGAVSGEELVEQFRSGKYEPGSGIYGNGFYFSVARRVADYFAKPEKKTRGGQMFRAALRKNARVIEYGELKTLREEWRKKIQSGVALFEDLLKNNGVTPEGKYSPAMLSNLTDPGRFAALMGYDAIRVVKQQDGAPYVKGEPSAKHPESGKRFSAHDQYVVLNRTALVLEAIE